MSAPYVLFLCTANYYRSRFAELYFNQLAEQGGLNCRADSAGLEMHRWRGFNPGEISIHTLEAMEALGFPHQGTPRAPKQFEAAQLKGLQRCIALSETEHRPIVLRDYPQLIEHFEFWTIEDIEFESPESALGRIQQSVQQLLHELSEQTSL